ncbi:MAG TPA: hypothetical protein VF407_14105 [Polyangiaceae bacterium]
MSVAFDDESGVVDTYAYTSVAFTSVAVFGTTEVVSWSPTTFRISETRPNTSGGTTNDGSFFWNIPGNGTSP